MNASPPCAFPDTIPADLAAAYLGVHMHTLRHWVADGLVDVAVPHRGPHSARYEVAELRRWRDECTAGHGSECRMSEEPFAPGLECQCVACHCGEASDPTGFLGSCARCCRPIVRDGRVVR